MKIEFKCEIQADDPKSACEYIRNMIEDAPRIAREHAEMLKLLKDIHDCGYEYYPDNFDEIEWLIKRIEEGKCTGSET